MNTRLRKALQVPVGSLINFTEMYGGRQMLVMRIDWDIDLIAKPGKEGINTLSGVGAKKLNRIKGCGT